MSSNRLLMTMLAAACLAACSEITFQGGGPVTIKMTPDRTSVPEGGTVTFTYDAKGTFLNGVIFDYGDGAVDSVSTQGAQTAAGAVSHAFGLAGSYTVVGRAEDASTGTATAEALIQVGGP